MLQLLPIIGIWTRPATLIAPSHSLEAIPSTADTLYLVFSWITFAAVAEALKFPPFSTTNFTGWTLIGPNSFAAAASGGEERRDRDRGRERSAASASVAAWRGRVERLAQVRNVVHQHHAQQ